MKFLCALGKNKKPYSIAGLLLLGFISFVVMILGWLNRGDWIYPEQFQVVDTLQEDLRNVTVGQTFVADQAGLQAISVRFSLPDDHPGGTFTLRLRESPEAAYDLRRASVSTSASNGEDWLRFSFEPLPDSRTRYYYFYIETKDNAASDGVAVYYGPPEAYLDGAVYLNGQPQEGQLAFRLLYNRPAMAREFVQSVIFGVPNTLAVLLLLILPGGALLLWLWPGVELDWFGWLALAVGLSLACFPIIILLAWALGGWRIETWLVWSFIFVSGGIWGYRLWRNQRYNQWRQIRIASGRQLQKIKDKTKLVDIIIFLLALTIMGSRLWIVRNLTIPLWGDSYHHTVIAQLLSEHGGLFNSWQPYTFSSTFSYHFGFHAFVVFFQSLTQLPMPRAVILVGQILNALSVLLLYPLAYRLSDKQPWAGVTALLVAGLVSTMPAFYVNWGRYTQLTGHIFLVIAALAIIETFQQKNWRIGVLAILSTAGLALSHYRVTIMLIPLIVVWMVMDWIQKGYRWTDFREKMKISAWLSLGIAVLLSPWIFRMLQGKIPSMGVRIASRAPKTQITLQQWSNELKQMFTYTPDALLWVLLITLIVGLGLRQRSIITIFLWIVGLLVLGNPGLLALPGKGLITAFAVQIALYIPVALLTGMLVGIALKPIRQHKFVAVGLSALTLVFIIIFLPVQLSILDRTQFAMAARPDERAALWIKENITSDALFYVDGFPAFNDSVVVGDDGGWWLPLLAARKTTMPPISYTFEHTHSAKDRKWVKELIFFGKAHNLALDETINWLSSQGITHIYLGQQRGAVGNPGSPLFSAELLLTNSRYHLIYQQDRVRIFAIE